MHSQLSAGRNLIFGNNNGKGVTIGGTNYGQYGVSANFIGSDAYVKTNVSCGALAELKKQQHQTENKIKLSSKELALLETMLNKIKNKGTPTTLGQVVLKKAKKIFDEINAIKAKISELDNLLKKINNNLTLCQNAIIQVNNKLYSNVHITINDVNSVSNREHEQSIISCTDYQIQFN